MTLPAQDRDEWREYILQVVAHLKKRGAGPATDAEWRRLREWGERLLEGWSPRFFQGF